MKKGLIKLLTVTLISSLAAFSLSSVVFSLFSDAQGESTTGIKDDFEGSIKTNQYFDKVLSPTGTAGSSTNPYVITRPAHLYNLSRLVKLGLISKNSCFEIGKKMTADSTIYQVYASDGSYSSTLDMSSFTKEIYPIGSEITPFLGQIAGHDITISNLTIDGNGQDDVGVFGYVASSSKISNIRFSNLIIKSEGYKTSSSINTAGLYADTLPTSIDIPDFYYGDTAFSSISKKSISDSSYLVFKNSSSSGDTIKIGDITYSYEIGLDSLLLSDSNSNKYVNTSLLSTLTTGKSTNVPFYVVAHYFDNLNYVSRVIKTYDVVIANDSSSGLIINNATLRTKIHGFNIGYVAGHCDGSISNVYVDDSASDGSKIETNNSSSSYTAAKQNSSYGLIGLVSTNVANNSSSNLDGEGGNVYDKELKPDVNILSGSVATGASNTSFSPFTLWGSIKPVTTSTVSFNPDSATNYTNYYSSTDKKFTFPTSYANSDNSTSLGFRASEYSYDATSSHNCYEMQDFTNRAGSNAPQRCIQFSTTGPGLILCIYSSSKDKATTIMMMKNDSSYKDLIDDSGLTSTSTTQPNGSINTSTPNVFVGRNVFGANSIATSTGANNYEFCYFEIPKTDKAANYYFGGGSIGSSAYVHVAYMRFIFASDTGNAGEYSEMSISDDTINNVEFSHTYNSTTYNSGIRFAFREDYASNLLVYVYFDTTKTHYAIRIKNTSSDEESITVNRVNPKMDGITYPNIDIYINSSTSIYKTLTASGESSVIKITSSTT